MSIYFPQKKLQSVSGALYKPNLCIKNIHFCDHKGYIKVKRHFIFEVHVSSDSTRVFTEHRNIKQRSLAFIQKKQQMLQRGAEWSDQKSGLFSKCWRVFSEVNKLPSVREVTGNQLEDTQKSIRKERDVGKGLIIESDKTELKQGIGLNKIHFTAL